METMKLSGNQVNNVATIAGKIKYTTNQHSQAEYNIGKYIKDEKNFLSDISSQI